MRKKKQGNNKNKNEENGDASLSREVGAAERAGGAAEFARALRAARHGGG